MDNLCHTLVGAAFGEAGLKSQVPRGNVLLMIAANLPDIDALAFVSDVPSVALRRGWTHGILAQALLPVAFAAVVLAGERLWPGRERPPRMRAGPLLVIGYVGVLSHVGLDWLNNYGIRLLMPFSGRWYYGDSVFIIDPWIWLMLGIGIWLARRAASRTPARAALAAVTVYIAVMVVSAMAARAEVAGEWARSRGAPPAALMVGPVPVNPFLRAIIVDDGGRYHTGWYRLLSRDISYDAATVPKSVEHPAVARARTHRRVQAVLVWARFPYFEVTTSGDGVRVILRDLRFGSRVGAVAVTVPPP